ncbi:DUF3526 domain-containing protein [Lutibacter sp. A80]|uniref:DUF3526 domain-containing protein n=1 Tax=Lutibacter sp. A80 TaxID=2918453 RepID=UPI001F055C2E|nr:DUF3526 domain-containing protein [Lutibacter sp. A80]UMB60766.1 DUF3526 domain-containing protein [Lutibacter sp. A80]
MIKKTIIKELKEFFRDGRIKISALIVLLLLSTSVWISYNQYKNSSEEVATAKLEERAIWENQGDKNPHSAAHYGTYVFKPKHPLSLLDQGVDKYVGTSIFLTAHNRNEAAYSKVADQTGLARFGVLSPDFVLLFIIPLLIILIGYNSITKERDMGTMSLLKSQGISFWKIILGKWLAIFIPILGITTLLFAIAGVLLSSIKGYTTFSWASLATLYIVYLSYYAIFINIVLFVSQLVKKSGVSLVVLLGIWIVSCLAAPKAASNFAGSKYPYPTRQEFASTISKAKKEGLDGHNPWNEEAKQLEKDVLAEYGVDSLHQLPFNFSAYRMQKGEEYQASIYKSNYAELKKLFEKQTATYNTLSIISPFLPARFLSMGIARTDYHSHWSFTDASEAYRIATQKFLNDNLATNTKYGERGYLANEETWKKLPKFSYAPQELSAVLKQQKLSVIALLVWFFFTAVLLFIFKPKN